MATARSISYDDKLSAPFVLDVLRSLVATPSVNPGTPETAMAECVARWFEGMSVECEMVESMPNRHSLAVVLRGASDGPTLVLNGHIDTVPVDDEAQWTTDPFGGDIRDGYLYGRGACDMKAGLAVQVAVAHYFAQHRNRMAGNLTLHFAAGEERGEPGTLSLLEAGFGGDYGITTEPTSLRVATATRGLAFLRISITGRSIHAGRAEFGVNPIPPAADVLAVIDGYRAEIQKRHHPLLGCGSLTPTMIHSGVAENAVPDACDMFFDRRLIPGETVADELADLDRRLAAVRERYPEVGVTIAALDYPYAPAEITDDSPFARRVVTAFETVTGRPTEIWGAPFASDVRNLVNDAGIEAITFGPGNVTECHCADERVAATELEDAARVIAQVAEDLLLTGDCP
jgi:succinyl-diaminopimelate desuccinylase